MQLRTRPPKFVTRALQPTITMPGFLIHSPELHSHVLLVSRSSKAFATSALASPTAKSHQNETVSSSTELDPTGNSKCNTLRNSKISSLTCLDNYILCNCLSHYIKSLLTCIKAYIVFTLTTRSLKLSASGDVKTENNHRRNTDRSSKPSLAPRGQHRLALLPVCIFSCVQSVSVNNQTE